MSDKKTFKSDLWIQNLKNNDQNEDFVNLS